LGQQRTDTAGGRMRVHDLDAIVHLEIYREACVNGLACSSVTSSEWSHLNVQYFRLQAVA